ncbi:MAG: hypothetical protein F6K63_21705, partial [Moorea sp. SIO1G6]|nr:hypothetical protein [Moorena sp. SIO1G6]
RLAVGHAKSDRIPNPDSRFPIPDSQFPIPDSRFPNYSDIDAVANSRNHST